MGIYSPPHRQKQEKPGGVEEHETRRASETTETHLHLQLEVAHERLHLQALILRISDNVRHLRVMTLDVASRDGHLWHQICCTELQLGLRILYCLQHLVRNITGGSKPSDVQLPMI